MLWTVGSAHFEVIHGVWRVLLLIPDKLATALIVNAENLANPAHDGAFLVVILFDLVPNLLFFLSAVMFLGQYLLSKA
jgi:hypothetical protein